VIASRARSGALRALGASVLATGLVLFGQMAMGFVPEADRVTRAVAAVNKSSGRAQALRFDLDMRIDDGDVIAIGELVTHPTGLARLELRGSGGLVERHVLQGSFHQASRNGVRLEQHRSFLPPLFLLQADSKVTLDAALEAFGVRSDAIGLAPCGQGNCYVLGDPGRIVPLDDALAAARPERVEPQATDPLAVADAPGASSAIESPAPAGKVLGAFATIWVDIVNFDLMRIESRSGVRTTLGPVIASNEVRAPSWILIEEPGQSVVRFEVTGVTPVNAPAVAFGEGWLLAPVDEERPAAPGPPTPEPRPPVDPQKS
jgi:hypothetical protein